MIAAELESRIVEALDRAVAIGAQATGRRAVIKGLWQMAGEGRLGQDLKPVGAVILVSVAPPSFDQFSFPLASFACSVSATFYSASKAAADATVLPTCGAIDALLAGWHYAARCGQKDLLQKALSFRDFDASVLTKTGGSAPTLDESSNAWTATWNFTLGGVCP